MMKRLLAGFAIFFAGSFNLWAQQIEPIKAVKLAEQYGSENGVVVINFWSTWCKPCIEEIPGFIDVYDSLRTRGVKLWLVSQDTRELYHTGKLKSFIAKKNGWSRAKLFWFDETNADYYCPIINKDWSGVIPATLILNNQKGYSKFIEEAMTAAQLVEEIGKAF